MNIELRCEITKVEPCLTAGKDEAPRRFIKVKLTRGFDDELAAELNARDTLAMLRGQSLKKATIGIDRLTLRGTFRGLGRGQRQGMIAIVLHGVKATGSASEEGDPTVDLVFNADYSEGAMVFLGDNVKNTVDVKLEDVQPELAAPAPESAWAGDVPASDDPTAPQEPPKKRGRKKREQVELGNA